MTNLDTKMFRGTFTALVTPFNEDGSFDYRAFRNLIEYNITSGVTGCVPCGTTGEASTLKVEEQLEVIKFAVDFAKHSPMKFPIIAGTGGNNTDEVIHLTKGAEKLGADAALIVCPYYNKPSQEGIARHYDKVAKSTSLPIIVYNIKGRTGVNIETSTLMRIASENNNIIGVKEASGDKEQILDVIKQRPKNFLVLSGDDSLTSWMIENGGDGVISVASNAIPYQMSKMVSFGLNGPYAYANLESKELDSFFKATMSAGNPVSVKYILSKMGMCENVLRLPLCPASESETKSIDALIGKYNLD